MGETEDDSAGLQRLEKVRPLVNEILERFNQERIEPEDAAMVILALTHRLLGVLGDMPEARVRFLTALINLINADLIEEPPDEDLGGML